MHPEVLSLVCRVPGIVFRNLTFEADRLLPDLVTLGGRLTLVGGKGGVGKTTTAAALALALAERGREVLVLSVDPAHSLGDALGVELGGEPSPVPGGAGLMAMEIDPERERQRFLGTHRGALLRILERGTYLDAEDAAGLVDLAVPGMDELAALFRLLELTADEGRHLVVDTAPTGHALRLLDLPRAARQWMAALEAMEAKHRAVAGALVGGLPEDEGARLLEALDSDLARLEALLTSADRCRFLLVTTPEPVVLAETRRYEAELTRRTVALGGVIVNRSRAGVPAHALGAGMVFVPPLADEPRGPDGLRRFAASARDAPVAEGGRREAAPAGIRVDGAWAPPTDRTLYLVGGKGGVGKSTSAAALALCVAERRPGRVLLLGTDPAGSLGDVLGVEVGGAAAPVRGQPGLWVQQVDAHAGWQRFRERYRAEVELLFEGLVSRGLSASSDQRVVERLLDLAPPGLDELVALLEVVDASGDGVYDALVVDTAPTGHLLRLLQLPELALQWTHTLLRLLLKYREVIGLGELAERVLQLARSLRSLQGRLRDPRDCWFLAVALPESLSVPETERLLASLRELQVPVGGVLLNRLLDEHGEPRPQGAAHARALIDRAGPLPCVAAPDLAEAPRGVEGLRRLAAGWRKVGGGEKGDRLDRNGNRA